MKIAIFTETFLPKVDGIARTVTHLLDHLALRGHESILFAPHGGIEQFAKTRIVGLPGFNFPMYPELQLVPPWVRFGREVSEFDPELVVLINPASLGIAGLQYARRNFIPVVASYNTDIPGYAERWGMPYLREPLWAYFRWIHNRADLNYVPSEFTREQICGQGIKRVRVWAKGVDMNLFNPNRRSADMRLRLSDGDPDAPLLLYVGRVAPEKRIDMILPVLKAFPETRLAIVGDGPDRPRLEEIFTGTKTVFTGYMRGEELASAYASADIFAFPSANETFGNVVMEAMSAGLPVVVPRSGGVVSIVNEGKTGFFFDTEDTRSFVETIRPLIKDKAFREKIGAQARTYAEGRSWTTIQDELLEDFAALIEEGPTHSLPLVQQQIRNNPFIERFRIE